MGVEKARKAVRGLGIVPERGCQRAATRKLARVCPPGAVGGSLKAR